jgi:chromosome segregation ATPase
MSGSTATFNVTDGTAKFDTGPGGNFDVTRHSLTIDKKILIQRINGLRKEIEETKEINSDQKRKWEEDKANLTQEIALLKERHDDSVKNMKSTVESRVGLKLAPMQQKLESKVRELANLELEKQNSDDRTKELETAIKGYIEEIKTKNTENEELKNMNTRLVTELKRAQTEVTRLNATVGENNDFFQLNKEFIDKLSGIGQTWFSQNPPAIKLEIPDDITEYIEFFINYLISRCKQLPSMEEELNNLRQALDGYKNHVKILTDSNTGLTSALTMSKNAVHTLEVKNETLETKITTSLKDVQKWKTMYDELMATKGETDITNATQTHIITDLTATVGALRRQLEEANKEYTANANALLEANAAATAQSNFYNKELLNKDAIYAELLSEKNGIEATLEKNMSHNKDLTEAMERTTRRNQDLTSHLNIKDEEIAALKEENRLALADKETNDQLKEVVISTLRNDIETKSNEINTLEEELLNIFNKVEEGKQENSKLVTKNKNLVKTNRDLTTQLENAQAREGKVTSDLAELEKRNADLTTGLVKITMKNKQKNRESNTADVLRKKLKAARANTADALAELAATEEKANTANALRKKLKAARANTADALAELAATEEKANTADALREKLEETNAELEKDLITAKWDFRNIDLRNIKGKRSKRSLAQREFSDVGLKVLQDADNSDLDMAESEDENGKQTIQDVDNRKSGITNKFRKGNVGLSTNVIKKNKLGGARKRTTPENKTASKTASENIDQLIKIAEAEELTEREKELQNQFNTPTPLDMVLF